jgi:adenylyltransferase/sulfurtransferase
VTGLIDYNEFCGIRPEVDLAMAGVQEISAKDLNARLERGDDVVVLDVREPLEFELCRIPGSMLIPLGELPARMSELDSAREMVVHCRTGVRSAQAIAFLKQAGFSGARMWNLKGGIHAWADDVDPSLAKY